MGKMSEGAHREMSGIGFVLLTHDKPRQVERLATRLAALFPQSPLACHHDWGQTALNRDALPTRLRFVEPHIPTAWAEYSVVAATFAALRLLDDAPGGMPEWIAVLSGADYPCAPADMVLRDLETAGVDGFVEHTVLSPGHYWHPYSTLSVERYLIAAPLTLLRPRRFRAVRVARIALSAPLTPFTRTWPCRFGSQWFTLHRRAARYLLRDVERRPSLLAYYAARPFPEESLIQTILGNAPHLTLARTNRRYIDWSGGGAHPKMLTLDDFPAIVASGAHFARKMDLETAPDLYDALDRHTSGVSLAASRWATR